MALTPSKMVELGTAARDFKLPEPGKGIVQLSDFRQSAGLLVAFICNHCPYVKHVRKGLASLGEDLQKMGLGVVGINSNDFESYPEDSPDKMVEEKRLAGYTFPYLVDETQKVAAEYGATCTPDFFLFDNKMRLFYRGQMDGSRPGNKINVTGEAIRSAVELMLAAKASPDVQIPSMGCNIKWK